MSPDTPAPPRKKKGLLPPRMLQRWLTMLVWVAAISMTSFGAFELASSTAVFALAAIGLVLLVYAMWGPRTRPSKNAFWFLVHIVLIAGLIGFATTRPLLGFVAAIPVALFWIHDAPASPSAMLGWGFILALLQPDFWSQAEPENAWDVLVATLLIVAAAQMERNRLASRQYTQAGPIFSLVRLAAVGGLSFLFIAGREGMQAVNAFTYIGIDASGIGGKLTLIGFVAISIAIAVVLFRLRPEKPPKLTVASASKPRKAVDFDEKSTRKKVDAVTDPGARMAKDLQQKANKPRRAAPNVDAAKPGEIDFD